MSAADEDTELRDLLIQTLENNGVLNKIKAELRASVFLALEEQDKAENKTPLVNESLKKFLNTRDGRLVAGLFTEFLQFFNLDFTLAVFQPESCLGNVPDDRSHLARDLGIMESEGAKNGPLLLELVKKWRLKDKLISGGENDKPVSVPKELSPKQIAEAQKKFDFYDKDRNGLISKDELRILFVDLFPHFHRNMLERYVNDEFKAADKDFNNGIDFHEFIGMYKRLFIHCRSVVTHDVSDILHSPRRIEGKPSVPGTQNKVIDTNGEKHNIVYIDSKKKIENNNNIANDAKLDSKAGLLFSNTSEGKSLEIDEEDIEGDSFFDDPIPKPEKTYGCLSNSDANNSGKHISGNGGNPSQKLKNEPSKSAGGFSTLTTAPPLKTDVISLTGAPRFKDSDKENIHASFKVIKGSPGDGDEDYYADDFNSTSQRSDKSEISIGEEIEEDLSIDDLNISDKLEDLTLDHTLSHISDVADYLEDVS
ncbi:centrosomal protein 43 isoform X2 [Bombina bombina]|uniref:centrosomal protein 43 isoform X2 n=1 Tax=Bombina bombina TaxID=8345 RepID=UPI00235A894D|nr:centrosomal protein 43 isoform X2 [Bombina bombina]